jgi:hypothetical protein
MQKIRTFHVTTDKSPEGIEYSYVDQAGTNAELLAGIKIRAILDKAATDWLIANLQPNLSDFLKWASTQKGLVVVELAQRINFLVFWDKYDDKLRSSKKRSEKLWDKLSQPDQAKAYYFIDTYNRNRGSAEKKYCETYLNAELWNN